MTGIDFYEIGLQRKRRHGCALISILFIAIFLNLLVIFHSEVFEYWRSITDPYYYPPEWDRSESKEEYTYEDYMERQREMVDYNNQMNSIG